MSDRNHFLLPYIGITHIKFKGQTTVFSAISSPSKNTY